MRLLLQLQFLQIQMILKVRIQLSLLNCIVIDLSVVSLVLDMERTVQGKETILFVSISDRMLNL